MKTVTLSILLAAGAALASAATAQVPPTPASPPDPSFPTSLMNVQTHADPGWSGDPKLPCCDVDRGPSSGPFHSGLVALKAQDYAKAEKIFTRAVVRNQRSAEAHLFIGVTQMNLGKWDDAKKNLDFAARKRPYHPDPKSLLGVTYARLGDIAGANAQRAKLEKLADTCKADCEYIADGIQLIDEALAAAPATIPAAQF